MKPRLNDIVLDALLDGTSFSGFSNPSKKVKGQTVGSGGGGDWRIKSPTTHLFYSHREVYMVLGLGLSTRMAASPYHLTHTSPKWVSSRYPVVGIGTCLHKTAFGLCFFQFAQPSLVNTSKRIAWSLRSSVDNNGLDPTPTNGTDGRTRLIRAIQDVRIKLSARILELRKDLPMKVLFFLVGFYCATAFATVIGQTGDWDILSAALAVVLVEVIGALMYRASMHLFDKVRRLITMFNYWKAGLCMGLFLDSFKYEMNDILSSWNPFNFEIDDFPIFL